MIFSVTYYLELHNAITSIDVIFYQVKLLMSHNVQKIKITFVAKIWDI